MTTSSLVALSLPGAGLTGALYQIGALAALEDGVDGIDGFRVYIGHASGAILAAALAGGISAKRLYRALLDPADPFFPIERRHLVAPDHLEWQRTVRTAYAALRHGITRLDPRRRSPAPMGPVDRVVEELDRLEDSLPAGLFTMGRFERFLAEFFARRDIPGSFGEMPRPLRVIAYELDTGARTVFGSPGLEHVPVSLACAASCALPLFYSPVRIGDRFYIDGGLCSMTHFDVAKQEAAACTIVVNPRVPVSTQRGRVPTGHGPGASVRDKGLLWVLNQSRRIASQAMLESEMRHPPEDLAVMLLEPNVDDGVLFLENTRGFDGRRAVLESAYRTTRAGVSSWLESNASFAARIGLSAR